jgi:prepilin-type N-terminal cleavage/methylation domain-containing protein
MNTARASKTNLAFTLIELLIVIAILGVLAVVVLVLVNPSERFAQTRDAGRISTIAQLGRALEQYFINHSETYPDSLTWDSDLEGTGDIKNFPSGVEYVINSVSPCTTNARPVGEETFCYALDNSGNNYGGLIFSKLESTREVNRCNLIGNTYIVHSTADGKTGMICSNGDPSPWAAGSATYLE